MKTSAIAATAILALFLVASVSVATAHAGLLAPKADGGSDGGDGEQQTTTTTQVQNTTQMTTTTHQDGGDDGSDDGGDNQGQGITLSVGESITISNLTGQFVSVQGNSTEGIASGSLTLMVTGVLQDGVTLSITSGQLTLGNTTFSVTGGSVVLGREDESAIGSGTAGTASFIIQINGIQESSGISGASNVQVDLKTGASEFLVSLGTQASSGDTSGDSSGD